MPDLDDDLDWLYRRGRYGEGVATPAAGAGAAASARAAAAASRPAAAPRPATRTTGATAVAPPPLAQPAASPAPRPAPGRGPGAGTPPQALPPRPRPVPAAPGRSKKRHPIRTAIIAVAVLAIATVTYLVAVPMAAWSGLKHVAYEPAGTRPAQQPGTLFLLAGSDSRAGLTKAQQRELSTGSGTGNLADTIMLLYLPPSGQPALISIPRDSYVQVPGRSNNKINATYAIGGPKLLTATIEQNTGLRVDGYLGIGFGGFVNIIDAVGGIEQCPTADVNDDYAHLYIKKGCQTMNGVTALKYVRYRHDDPLGDLGRANRQRAMVAAVAKKAVNPSILLNPVAYYSLNAAGAAALTAGEGTGPAQIATAALAFQQISKGDGTALTVPVGNPDLRTSVGSAVEWDKAKAAELFGMIARGDTSQLDKFKK